MKEIESDLPLQIKNLVEKHLIGIFSVKDIGGSGYMEEIRGTDGKEKYGIIVIDTELLKKRKANEWAEWKENSFFKTKPGSSVRVRVVIESSDNNKCLPLSSSA